MSKDELDYEDIYSEEEKGIGDSEKEGVDGSTLMEEIDVIDEGLVSKDSIIPEDTAIDKEVIDEEPERFSIAIPDGDIEFEDDGTEDDIYTPEEKMRVLADDILSCMVGKKEIRVYAINRLLSSMDPKLFRDENYILYSILYSYRDKLKRINIDSEFIRMYLTRNKDIILKARSYIDVHAYGEVNGSEALGYITGVIKHFNRLLNKDEIDVSAFETSVEKYLIEYKSTEAQRVYAQSAVILKDGLTVGNKLLVGFLDSYNYSRRKLAELDGLTEMNQGSGFTNQKELLMDSVENKLKPVKIGDFHNLKALTDIYGGIYSGMFYEVMAPSKAGKSKFCARAVHTVSVAYGNNVTVWAAEGGSTAWVAQMRAIHFDYTYNTGVDTKDRRFGVDQDCILKDKFPSDEYRELEMSSKLDLASNPEYGSVDYIDRPFEVETFLEDIDTSVKSNNSKMVVLDYLQLMGTCGNKTERERVSDAYKLLLNYCKKNNVAILTPAQFKQESFNEMLSKNDTSVSDVRTSGGVSAEVFRTPDIIFALWATTVDLQNNRMKILSVPCRFNKAFPEIPCYTDLGACDFVSLKDS